MDVYTIFRVGNVQLVVPMRAVEQFMAAPVPNREQYASIVIANGKVIKNREGAISS